MIIQWKCMGCDRTMDRNEEEKVTLIYIQEGSVYCECGYSNMWRAWKDDEEGEQE